MPLKNTDTPDTPRWGARGWQTTGNQRTC